MEPAGEGQDVSIDAGGLQLGGTLAVPDGAAGVVLFAHGSGSSRYSPRNRAVARALRAQGLGTLLMDLLSVEEEEEERFTRHLRFDLPLLARRLSAATEWMTQEPRTGHLQIGYFGSSTGAGAALIAAAMWQERVGAVVSRGGRPDLAGPALGHVRSPTLLIVGSRDDVVLDLNREAMAQMPRMTEKKLEVIDGATHLFEEPGALERVSQLAARWFREHLSLVSEASPSV
ncbi:MAG TPA: alpha/beta family hydrolase [Myxococcales bacterium]|nr:alpha/beta family hydrolase [Myxococcales bacterium]